MIKFSTGVPPSIVFCRQQDEKQGAGCPPAPCHPGVKRRSAFEHVHEDIAREGHIDGVHRVICHLHQLLHLRGILAERSSHKWTAEGTEQSIIFVSIL